MRLFVVVLSVGLLWCSPALAQSTVPPDVVVTRSGEMARGTVMQVIPGDHVVLALPDGTSRTFVADDVEYVGPAALAPMRSCLSLVFGVGVPLAALDDHLSVELLPTR